MTQSKHTPAPWKAEQVKDSGLFKITCDKEIYGKRCKVASQVGHDDARLIAAAPELLEALQGMLEVFADDTNDCEDMATVIFARKAIKKAKGE